MNVVSVSRKPCSEGTVAANALKWGTGGINIDGSRIGTSDNLGGGAYAQDPNPRWDGAENWRYKRGQAGEFKQPTGRWPANLILCHKTGCRQVGEKKVKASYLNHDCTDGNLYGAYATVRKHEHASPDGTETVTAWECEPGCPVAELDRQSGHLRCGWVSPQSTRNASIQPSGGGYGGAYGDIPMSSYPDSGGASRFFKQVHMADTTLPQDLIEYLTNMIGAPGLPGIYWERIYDDRLAELADNSLPGLVVHGTPTESQTRELNRVLMPGAHLLLVSPDEDKTGYLGTCRLEDGGFEIRDAIFLNDEPDELFYVAKAARAEREEGCRHLPARAGFEAVDRDEDTAGLQSPRAGAGRTASMVRNFHPTVKAIGIMELLLTDVPQEKLVCDPFLGSGTTGIACLQTHHDFLGIERDAEYLPIASARVRHWDEALWRGATIKSDVAEHQETKLESMDALDFLLGGDDE